MSEPLLTFQVDGLLLGVPVGSVDEVLRHHRMTRVPLAQPCIGGLLNLRGRIVLAVELRQRLMLPARPPEISPRHVVVRSEDEHYSLLVDDIGDVMNVDGLDRERVPDRVPPQVRELATGVFLLPGRLLMQLDVGRIVQTDSLTGAAREMRFP